MNNWDLYEIVKKLFNSQIFQCLFTNDSSVQFYCTLLIIKYKFGIVCNYLPFVYAMKHACIKLKSTFNLEFDWKCLHRSTPDISVGFADLLQLSDLSENNPSLTI